MTVLICEKHSSCNIVKEYWILLGIHSRKMLSRNYYIDLLLSISSKQLARDLTSDLSNSFDSCLLFDDISSLEIPFSSLDPADPYSRSRSRCFHLEIAFDNSKTHVDTCFQWSWLIPNKKKKSTPMRGPVHRANSDITTIACGNWLG